jgi:hypothetical protein
MWLRQGNAGPSTPLRSAQDDKSGALSIKSLMANYERFVGGTRAGTCLDFAVRFCTCRTTAASNTNSMATSMRTFLS